MPGGQETATPPPPPPPRAAGPAVEMALVGSWAAEYQNDDGNQVSVNFVLYDDQTFTRETVVTRGAAQVVVQSAGYKAAQAAAQQDSNGSEVLSRSVVSGTWEAEPNEDEEETGTIRLEVTSCDDEDCSGTDVEIGETLELEYEQTADGEVEVEVAPGATTTRSALPPRVTSQIPSVEIVMAEPATIDLSGHFTGADTYSAVSSDNSYLTVAVAGSVLTLTPVAETPAGTTVTVTATGTNDGGSVAVDISMAVVAAVTEATPADRLIGTWDWTDDENHRRILTFTETRWIDVRLRSDGTAENHAAESGTWSISGNTITRIWIDHGQDPAATLRVDKDLQFGESDDAVMMHPWNDEEPADTLVSYSRIEDPVPEPPVGTWTGTLGPFQNDDGTLRGPWAWVFEFSADGSFLYEIGGTTTSGTVANVDASFVAAWGAGGNYTIILTNQRVITWEVGVLPDVLDQTLRLAYAPTHRQDQILLSSYWVDQEKDANGDWQDSTRFPYGLYELLLTRQ